MLPLSSYWSLFRQSFTSWKEDNISLWSAALSYYTIFSLAPLLLLVISMAGFFWGKQAVEGSIYGQLAGILGKEGAAFIQQMLTKTTSNTSNILASLISIVTLILGATGIFGQLKQALNHIWKVTPKKDIGIWLMIRDRFFSLSLLVAIGFLLLISLVASAVIAILQTYFSSLLPFPIGIIELINSSISLGILTLLFGLLFKVLPDVEVKWRDIWIGSFVTALLFTIGKTLLGIYIGMGSTSSTYGAASSLIVLLVWVYYASQIIFFGAEFTKNYSLARTKKIVPSKYATTTINPVRKTENKKKAGSFAGMLIYRFFKGVSQGIGNARKSKKKRNI